MAFTALTPDPNPDQARYWCHKSATRPHVACFYGTAPFAHAWPCNLPPNPTGHAWPKDAHSGHTWPNRADVLFFSTQCVREDIEKLIVLSEKHGHPRCAGCKKENLSRAIEQRQDASEAQQEELEDVKSNVEVSSTPTLHCTPTLYAPALTSTPIPNSHPTPTPNPNPRPQPLPPRPTRSL